MNKHGMIGEILETGGTIAKKSGKSAVKQVSDFGKAAANQVAPDVAGGQTDQAQSQEDSTAADKTKDFVKDLYGIKKPAQAANQSQAGQNDPNKQTSLKEAEDKKALEELRKSLHKEYYQNLSEPSVQKEPTVQERLEREKMAKQKEEEEKKKKEMPQLTIAGTDRPDIGLQRAKTKTEIKSGVAG